MTSTPAPPAFPRGPRPRRPCRSPNWLSDQLPEPLLDDDLLARFVGLFQHLADTHLANIDQLEHVFDPSVAPLGMVRAMGAWIGVDFIDPALPDDLQRRIVLGMARRTPWRGTRWGLEVLLELITGAPALVEDSGGVYAEGNAPQRQAHVRLQVESTGWIGPEHLIELVQRELPASVTFELFVGEERVWPT